MISLQFLITLVVRLIISCILGGIIGYEREHSHRPAGFRTHILVCVGSSLVMLTSEYIFEIYKGTVNIDPTRLGAQVISGIGFLGAGTIIREGISVKGLTTAATLWAVSCVGIATGAGFYAGAAIATAIIYLTLIILKRFENHSIGMNVVKCFVIYCDNTSGKINAFSEVFAGFKTPVKSLETENNSSDNTVIIRFTAEVNEDTKAFEIIERLRMIEGVKKVAIL